MKRICVFCGSSPGDSPAFLSAAETLGRTCVRRGIGIVYGGASVGLMGRLATTVLEAGGEIIGVMPESLVGREVALADLSDLRVVSSMHERKALMADLSDGFVALPGGLGTLEEFLEALTWSQLGIHDKPCGLLNVEGYFDPILAFLDQAVRRNFIRPEDRSMVLVDDEPDCLLDRLISHRQPAFDKAAWILSLSGKS